MDVQRVNVDQNGRLYVLLRGAVKVTPGHSHEDCQVREICYPFLSILDSSGKVTNIVPEFEVWGAVPSALSSLGLYRGCHAHPMMVPRCSRTQDVIEPVLRPQCRRLGGVGGGCLEEDARRKAVEKEGTPWLLSVHLKQEEDVLDTWFSSGLFPFASLSWPGQGRGETMPDLARFYPTTLVKTGHDILFWVAQMVMLGLNLTGRLLFKTCPGSIIFAVTRRASGRKKPWETSMTQEQAHLTGSLVTDRWFRCILYFVGAIENSLFKIPKSESF
ncbi:hypothetical protein O3P69_016233 [Scylla paramamosain]|uniref:valine--tRNA ligase n=1 Tax=Scylla paramamosain TaxID=85552 RepID=A0AAW0S915_SCYPA